MTPPSIKIKPYKSDPILVYGKARCAVTFGSTSVPVKWHIISGYCGPMLVANIALQPGIISFTEKTETFEPILMIGNEEKDKLHLNFRALGS